MCREGKHLRQDKNVYILEQCKNITDLSGYTHIRAYHACRPININDYIENGIHTFSKEDAWKIVRERLMLCGIKEEKIKETFELCWDEKLHHFDKICVGISKQELLTHSGHYLVYGSEFICGMAAQLFCQNRLKRIGVPTLLVCDIDICKFSTDALEAIESGGLYDGTWDGGAFLNNNIDASEIIDYIHPKKMFDPLIWQEYRYIGNEL